MPPSASSFEQQKRVQNALRDKEEIRWLGRPVSGAINPTHRIAGLLGSLLLGFIGFHFALSPQSPFKSGTTDEHTAAIITLTLLSIIAFLLIRIPWKRIRTLKENLYLLTNQRIAILHPQKKLRDESIPLKAIAKVHHHPTSKNIGHIIVTPKTRTEKTTLPTKKTIPLQPLRLMFLRDPQTVASRIKDTADSY